MSKHPMHEERVRALVEGKLRLVVSVAKQFPNCDLTFLDLIQIGNIGLIEVAKDWSETDNAEFTAKAYWSIRQSILKDIVKEEKR